MNDTYKIRLTAEEICVLAAFLGYETVIGIDESVLSAENGDLKSLVKKTVEKLETEKLVSLSPGGSLFMEPEVKFIVTSLCKPDLFAVVCGSKGDELTAAERDGVILLLQKGGGNIYEITLTDSLKFFGSFIPKNESDESVSEELSLSDIRLIREKINSFDNDAALKKLKEKMRCETASPYIAALLSGKCRHLEMHIYKGNRNLYENTYNAFLVFCENLIFNVKNNGETVSFKTAKYSEVMYEAGENFKKKGASIL